MMQPGMRASALRLKLLKDRMHLAMFSQAHDIMRARLLPETRCRHDPKTCRSDEQVLLGRLLTLHCCLTGWHASRAVHSGCTGYSLWTESPWCCTTVVRNVSADKLQHYQKEAVKGLHAADGAAYPTGNTNNASSLSLWVSDHLQAFSKLFPARYKLKLVATHAAIHHVAKFVQADTAEL